MSNQEDVRIEAKVSSIETVTITRSNLVLNATKLMTYDESIRALILAFKRGIKIKEDAFLEDDHWCVEYEMHGSHSYFRTEKLRKATDEEIARYNAIIAIKDEICKE